MVNPAPMVTNNLSSAFSPFERESDFFYTTQPQIISRRDVALERLFPSLSSSYLVPVGTLQFAETKKCDKDFFFFLQIREDFVSI